MELGIDYEDDGFFDPAQFDQDLQNLDEMLSDRVVNANIRHDSRRRPPRNQQTSSSPNTVRDGKLILSISLADNNLKTRFPFNLFQDYYGDITVENSTKSLRLSYQSKKSLTKNKIAIFDVYEYFGPLQIKFSIQHKGLFSSTLIGTKTVTLHDISLIQDKSEAQWVHMDSLNTKREYWGCSAVLDLSTTNSSQVCKMKPSYKLNLQARYVSLRQCMPPICNPSLGPPPVSVSSSDALPFNELQHAVCYGTVEIVAELLDTLARKALLRGVVAYRTSSGYNILECAVIHKNINIVKVILQRAGNCCFQNTSHGSNCVLHHAVLTNDVQILAILIRFVTRYHASCVGWDGTLSEMVNWMNKEELTPLMLACTLGDSAHTSVQLLLKAGADCTLISPDKKLNVLMLACKHGALQICQTLLREMKPTASLNFIKGQQHVPLALYKCGPGERDKEGMQAILFASACGHGDILSLLLSLSVPYNIPNNKGETALHLAAVGGYTDCVEILLGAEEKDWRTHCEQNIAHSSLQRMQYRPRLLYLRNVFGMKPVDIASELGHQKIAKMLLKAESRIYKSSDVLNNEENVSVKISEETGNKNDIKIEILENERKIESVILVDSGEEERENRDERESNVEAEEDDEADDLDYAFAVVKRPHHNAYRPPVVHEEDPDTETEVDCNEAKPVLPGEADRLSILGVETSSRLSKETNNCLKLNDSSRSHPLSAENKEKETYDIELIESHSHIIGV